MKIRIIIGLIISVLSIIFCLYLSIYWYNIAGREGLIVSTYTLGILGSPTFFLYFILILILSFFSKLGFKFDSFLISYFSICILFIIQYQIIAIIIIKYDYIKEKFKLNIKKTIFLISFGLLTIIISGIITYFIIIGYHS